jgi:hypothetical protein
MLKQVQHDEKLGVPSVLPGPVKLRRRNIDQLELMVDSLEAHREEVAYLGRELIDEEGAALAERRIGLGRDLGAEARRQRRERQAGEDVVGMLMAMIGSMPGAMKPIGWIAATASAASCAAPTSARIRAPSRA